MAKWRGGGLEDKGVDRLTCEAYDRDFGVWQPRKNIVICMDNLIDDRFNDWSV